MAVDGSEIANLAKGYLKQGTDLDSGGFVQAMYNQFGLRIPRASYDQITEGNKIGLGDLNPGDLVFLDRDRERGPDTVGIYTGNGKFVFSGAGKVAMEGDLTHGDWAGSFLAGRRASGILGSGVDSTTESVYSRTKTDPMEMAAQYGWSYGFLNSNSELKNLFNAAVNEDWDDARLKAGIQGSAWWQETSETARKFQVMAEQDPATFAATVDASNMKLQLMANEIGAVVPDSVLARMAEEAVRTGMGDEQINASLSGYIKFIDDGTLGGKAGQAQFKLKQLAYMNGVSLTDQATLNYAQRIAAGVTTMEVAEQWIRDSASSMFPSYQEQIEGGQNMIDIAQPYIETLANTLELNPSDINMNDDRIKRALNGVDEQGNPVGKTFSQFETELKGSDEWLKTQGAQNQMMQVGNEVLKSMGLI